MTCPKRLQRPCLSLPAEETGLVWDNREEVSVLVPHPSKVGLRDLCPSTSNAARQPFHGIFRLELFESPLFYNYHCWEEWEDH